MKITTAVLLGAAAVSAPVLAAESYTIDPRHTFPSFEVTHLGFSTQRGRFNKASGKIVLDLAAKSGSVDISIDAASIDMGIDKWDEHMKSEDFFNAAQYPSISFKSDRLTFDGDKLVAVDGQLSLLGATKPVTLKVTHFHCGMQPVAKREACGADATATIRRSEFGMTKFVPGVGDEVLLRIPVEAFKD